MSSENNGPKILSSAPPPASAQGPRSNARVASTWGAARDALAAVCNLEALLRNSNIPSRTILDLLPELRSSAAALREAFGRSADDDPEMSNVCEQGDLRVAELEELLDAAGRAFEERAHFAERAGALADELEASVDLLAVLDRAAAPSLAPTEVTLDLVAREVGRVSGSARGRDVIVRFDEARPDCAVTTDPYVLGPLLSLVVASVHAAGVGGIVLRARCVPRARFEVEAAGPGDEALPTLSIRVMPWIPLSESAARRLAERLGASIELLPGRASIDLGPGRSD